MLKTSALTDIGRLRKKNQDNYDIKILSDDMVFAIVCDGMGGIKGGEVASKIAVETVCSIVMEHYANLEYGSDIKDMLIYATQRANESIIKSSQESAELSGMGTTIVACFIKGEDVHLINVGDSRAYQISENRVKQLTKDHSMVQELIEIGEISKEEAKTHPNKNIITRALGIENFVAVDYYLTRLNDNDKIMLCTDGFSNYVDNNKILEISNSTQFEEFAKTCVAFANESGGQDNVTVLAIEKQ